ncbi:MAG TPA: hypothetical protein VK601_06855, partial [Kofleriaceae bacterium]|nr:hypothetical protein [Kofleriaceae bacterium]
MHAIAAAQRTPARVRGDLRALRDPRCAVVGSLVKRNREHVRTLPGFLAEPSMFERARTLPSSSRR